MEPARISTPFSFPERVALVDASGNFYGALSVHRLARKPSQLSRAASLQPRFRYSRLPFDTFRPYLLPRPFRRESVSSAIDRRSLFRLPLRFLLPRNSVVSTIHEECFKHSNAWTFPLSFQRGGSSSK